METPLNFENPVAGNRRFGIYSDPDHPGEFVFYTMGVDRIWDWTFSSGNAVFNFFSDKKSFAKADSLWTSIQKGMIEFVEDNQGSASFYSKRNSIARPRWADVEEYLKGNIDPWRIKKEVRMLSSRIRQSLRFVFRFILCWIASSLLFSIWAFVETSESYRLIDKFLAVSPILFIVCVFYYGFLWFFSKRSIKGGHRLLIAITTFIVIALGFAFLWGNPFGNISVVQMIWGFFKLILIGVSIFLSDVLFDKFSKTIIN